MAKTRTVRAIARDTLTELVRVELEKAMEGGPEILDRARPAGEPVEYVTIAHLAGRVADGLMEAAWDLEHHPKADRVSFIWDVPE